MRLSHFLIICTAFLIAGLASIVAANLSVKLVEESSEIGVRDALDDRGLTWAEVSADGLRVALSGTAPTESLRFQALSAAGTVVDAARVIDEMGVKSLESLTAPQFSAEILRNDAGLSVIGLIPTAIDRDALLSEFEAIAGPGMVTDLLEVADYAVPEGWNDAQAFALLALDRLPRAKVSVAPNRVRITAISDSIEQKLDLEAELNRAAPPGLRLALNIAAPRPVLTPFTLRFVMDPDGVRFDACSADSETARRRIVDAAFAAGLTGPGRCTVGMGVPSPRWSEAVEISIAALAELGGGSVTFSDADITLVAAEGTGQAEFDRVVGELENALPPAFALFSKLPETVDPNAGPSDFVATLSPEGLVQLRGRVRDEAARELVDSFAKAQFGVNSVYTAARLDDDLPRDWTLRALAGLEALGLLSNGVVTVTAQEVSVRGDTGNEDANAQIAQLLASKLGETEQFRINVTYQEKMDPVAAIPTPEECEAEIKAITDGNKITFEPGSATVDESALGTIDDIAELLKDCGDLRLEIQGYTDSQGRAEMNLQLSQARAQSVLNELRARRVLTSTFSAKGYGEENPIASNETEEGREANRRIEFRLIRPAPTTPEAQSTLDSLAAEGAEGAEAAEEEGQGSE